MVGTTRAPRTSIGSDAAAKAAPTSGRDRALDIVKGTLVVFMAVYHAMNIFTNAGPDEYAYVRFVSGSFILISGYIIGKFSEGPFNTDWRMASRRLVIRGVKLLILFTTLNLLISVTGVGNSSKGVASISGFMSSMFEIYVIGQPRSASFQILLPIAYLLIVAPALLSLKRFAGLLFSASWAMAFAVETAGIESVNLGFVVLGLMGLAGGMWVNATSAEIGVSSVWSVLAALATTVWSMRYLNVNLGTYALGTIIILKLLYDLGRLLDPGSVAVRAMILLGHYSLVCYIGQIIFMQMLHRALSRPVWGLGYEVILVVVATIVFMLGASAALARWCESSKTVAKLYRLIFL